MTRVTVSLIQKIPIPVCGSWETGLLFQMLLGKHGNKVQASGGLGQMRRYHSKAAGKQASFFWIFCGWLHLFTVRFFGVFLWLFRTMGVFLQYKPLVFHFQIWVTIQLCHSNDLCITFSSVVDVPNGFRYTVTISVYCQICLVMIFKVSENPFICLFTYLFAYLL